jgi:SAM-dependent methyltransferase
MKNPHFDEGRLVWNDDYSGVYSPPPDTYDRQFDEKWSLFLSETDGSGRFNVGHGARTDDENVEYLAFEWTASEGTPHSRYLKGVVDPALIAGKTCMDAGCGSGRWTRVLQRLGADSVLSVDMSPASLQSVSRYNDNTLAADLTSLSDDHPELVEKFDFVNLWGVAHHTHDPKRAFDQAARTVKPGGSMYVMLYNPDGQHGRAETNDLRRIFSTLHGSERMDFLEDVTARRWSSHIPLRWNIKNVLRNMRGMAKGHAVGVLDMLSPFYNWTVPEAVVVNWIRSAGFGSVEVLNPGYTHEAGKHFLATAKE